MFGPDSKLLLAAPWVWILWEALTGARGAKEGFTTLFGRRHRLEIEKLDLEVQRLRLEVSNLRTPITMGSATDTPDTRKKDKRTIRIEWLLNWGLLGWVGLLVINVIIFVCGGLLLVLAIYIFTRPSEFDFSSLTSRLLWGSFYSVIGIFFLRDNFLTIRVVNHRLSHREP